METLRTAPYLSAELDLARRLARAAGDHAASLRGSNLVVERKDDDSPVTRADREADQMIVSALRAAYPADGILSEESVDDGSRLSARRVWMIDPIDGTSDYVRGHDGFATMIGLLDQERPSLGVIYQPAAGRMYYAVRGLGAFEELAGDSARPLRVSHVARLAEMRMVASKTHRTEDIDRVRERLGISDEMNLGSVGLKLGLIARGERDLYVNPQPHCHLWDVCAPEALLREAGGILTDLHGDPLRYRGELGLPRGLVASNAMIHDQVIARIAALFPRPAG